MVNSEDFIKRLKVLLQHYNLSASAFADKIGVQRSNISHLLSGRNKPSLEFVLRIVQTFPEVNLYWLLEGKGYFPDDRTETSSPIAQAPDAFLKVPKQEFEIPKKAIEQIIFFYNDGSFKIYRED